MDYSKEAFGEFQPESDKDAAIKFSLCVLVLDNRIDELLRLVEGGDNFGGVEGEPGWVIERREEGEHVGFEDWPEGAMFSAYVNPDSYLLAYPVFYADRRTFFQYVKAVVGAYKRHSSEKAETIKRIEEIVAKKG